MARGLYSDTFQISTNTDTAIVPAPGNGERIYVKFLSVGVATAGTTSRLRVENGQGGDVILRCATTSADVEVATLLDPGGSRLYNGYALSENTALNVNTSGSGAATVEVRVIWEVR
jgi:hypothetical protein